MAEIQLTKEQEQMLNEDIRATQELMLRNNGSYGMLQQLKGSSPFTKDTRYEGLYTFATEDMASYFKEFKVTDSFLTIGASGDQVINAINSGAKVIDVYDSNRLCRHAMHLKIAAIKALSYDEFIEYYKTFSPFIFVKIADYLPYEELMYWGTLYSMYGPSNIKGGDYLNSLLFTYKRLNQDLVKSINPYLNPENFEKLKSIINNVSINYIDSDLYGLPKHIEGKSYDVINLSNIYEYLNYSNDTRFKHARKYRNFVMNELFPHLNPNGTMLVSYLYAWSPAVHEDFIKMYTESKGKVVATGALNMMDYLTYYLPGLTTQNLAYHYLEEAFKEDPIERVQTEHVQYGQSKDMSHDIAILLRK